MEVIDLINVMASETSKICTSFKGVFGLAGWVLLIIKIAVPIILIIVGMIDMTKAIMGHDSDEISKAQGLLIKKAIAAIAVYLVIQIVVFIFTTIVGFTDWRYAACGDCLDHPSSCKIAD